MIRRGAVAVALAATAAAAWGSFGERRRFTLRDVEIPLLPTGTAPVRVLHLSDLHMAPWQREKQDWIERLSLLKPDLVLGTGDFLGHERGIDGLVRALSAFRGVPGAFVHGSNDYFAPEFKNPLKYFAGPTSSERPARKLNTAELEDFYFSLGWVDLNNAVARVATSSGEVELWGVDDAHKSYDKLSTVSADLDDSRSESPATPIVSIGVTHAPYRRVLDAFTRDGADLIVAGHTHGGQVCLPEWGGWGGTLVTNCDIPRSQAKGLSVWRQGLRHSFVNVSAGLGTSIYAPIRLFCPPEATLVTLTARSSSS